MTNGEGGLQRVIELLQLLVHVGHFDPEDRPLPHPFAAAMIC